MKTPHVPKILIVDDEPKFRRVLGLAPSVKGYDVLEAEGGAEAVRVVQIDPPDLILADWQMPDMDGIHLCHEIRATSDVPIIMVTAKQNGKAEALAAGAIDYITKPFVVDDLLGRIKSTLKQRR